MLLVVPFKSWQWMSIEPLVDCVCRFMPFCQKIGYNFERLYLQAQVSLHAGFFFGEFEIRQTNLHCFDSGNQPGLNWPSINDKLLLLQIPSLVSLMTIIKPMVRGDDFTVQRGRQKIWLNIGRWGAINWICANRQHFSSYCLDGLSIWYRTNHIVLSTVKGSRVTVSCYILFEPNSLDVCG